MRRRAARIAAALFAAVCLNGCVAAALPALAGAVMVRDKAVSEPGETGVEVAEMTPPATATTTASATASAAGELDAIEVTNVIYAPIPPPSGAASDFTGRPVILNEAFGQLIAYARNQVAAARPIGTLRTAFLEKPSSLKPDREECIGGTPMVLIDLDTKAKNTQPIPAEALPALGNGLQSLRDQGIEIAWISERSAAEAGDISFALQQRGLDPAGTDTLILMRYPGDRKQTRRKDLAETACVVAIAGDTREDFDELFEYLVKPDAALELELLIGEGWFLVPPVLGKEL